MEEILKLEREKDAINEKLMNWTRMGILDIVRLKRERQAIQEKLDKLYQELP